MHTCILFSIYSQYKYQISIDGTVAAYRLPYLLAGDSVVLKQESPYYEYFYKEVRAHVYLFTIVGDRAFVENTDTSTLLCM